jgi:hypothetical protein
MLLVHPLSLRAFQRRSSSLAKKGEKRRSSSHLIELMTINVELFYDGSCHLISLLERIILKDSTVEINWIPLRLNMWYRVVCIGCIGVLLVVFLRVINEIYDSLFQTFLISLWWYGQFFFQILKMKIFISNFKIDFFSKFFHFKIFLMPQTKFFIFHFSLVVWLILFKFQNENFHFKFQTWKFKIFYFHVVVWSIFQI